MSKRKTMASIDAAIELAQRQLLALEKRQARLTEELVALQKERAQRQAEEIFEAFQKSGKTYRQLMTFLGQ